MVLLTGWEGRHDRVQERRYLRRGRGGPSSIASTAWASWDVGSRCNSRNTFPGNFKAYAEACKRNEVRPGRMFVFQSDHLTNPRYIINFPTKRHWRSKSRIEDIESGLEALASEIRERNISSIAIPPLGTNLGGLTWTDVYPRIETALQDIDDLKVIVFLPGSAPADGRPQPVHRCPEDDGSARHTGQLDAPIPERGARPVRDASGITQAHVLHTTGREPLRLDFQKGPMARMPRDSDTCSVQ